MSDVGATSSRGEEVDAGELEGLRRELDLQLAIQRIVTDLAVLEAELRGDVIRCCDDRHDFCESYGCSTITDIADRLQATRRTARNAIDPTRAGDDDADPASQSDAKEGRA